HVRTGLATIGRDGMAASELLVRAARWDRGGRQRNELAARTPLRGYRNVVQNFGPTLPSDARQFVSRSRSRQLRRRIFAVAGSMIITVSVFSAYGLDKAGSKVRDDAKQADT